MVHYRRLLACLVLAAMATGCGDGRFVASGRLTKNGEPYVVPENETVHLALVRVQDGTPSGNSGDSFGTYVALFDKQSGTFRVTGADGKGLPPGKYRVTLEVLKNKKDVLKGAFGIDNSPLVREVTGKADELNLDLEHPNG